jgi:hypothetical protein
MPSQPSFEFLDLAPCQFTHSLQSEGFQLVATYSNDYLAEPDAESIDVRSSETGRGRGNARARQICKLEVLEEAESLNQPIKAVVPDHPAAVNSIINDPNSLISNQQEQPCVYGYMLDIFPWIVCVLWMLSILLS